MNAQARSGDDEKFIYIFTIGPDRELNLRRAVVAEMRVDGERLSFQHESKCECRIFLDGENLKFTRAQAHRVSDEARK